MAGNQTPVTEHTGPFGALTDGTGVSRLTGSKLLKDFVADALLSGAAAIGALNITGLQDVATGPDVVVFAVAGAVIAALYRSVLRWATS